MRLAARVLVCTLALAACAREGGEPMPMAPVAAADSTDPQILVRFTGAHPLARAEDLEAAGNHSAATALARAALAEDPALAGLCFERFTLGGAEIVIGPCEPLADAASRSFVSQKLERLRAMGDVAYAEENYVADAE